VQVGAALLPSTALLPIAINPRRDDVAERSTAQARRQLVIDQPAQPAQREVTRIRTRASVATHQANSQAQQTLRDLPARERSALQSYLSNGPSIQERLGVELAGIDTYA
jgi:hypothetical protein